MLSNFGKGSLRRPLWSSDPFPKNIIYMMVYKANFWSTKGSCKAFLKNMHYRGKLQNLGFLGFWKKLKS